MRVLGVDPGLTRCGIGIVESVGHRDLKMVDCGVIRTDVEASLELRLLELNNELELWINKFQPDVIAIERVFSQLNVRTAMATGQAAGVALVLAAIAVVAGLMVNPKVWLLTAMIYVAFILYFILYSRFHLVKGTPEEEFARVNED